MQQIQYDIRPAEFHDAMKSTRSARLVFWLLLGLAIILQLAAFGLVEFGGVLDNDRPAVAKGTDEKTPAAPDKRAPSAAAKKPPATAAGKPDEPEKKQPSLTKAEKWRIALRWSLPATKFIAMVTALLLTLTILFAVGLSLVGRLGGMAGLISAFFWSLILFVMVVPWQQVLVNRTLACGALFNLGELLAGRSEWGGAAATGPDTTLYYGRFAVYPGAALLIWLIVHVKFVRASMRMHFPHAVPSAAAARATLAAPGSDEPKA
ncbi:MAG: hypothetical protein WBF17_19750, partial [Phycisphaerae bacterium]